MNNVVPMRARAPWMDTDDGKLLAQWKWLLALNGDPEVSSAGKHVALFLIDKFDEAKGYAFPGYASITKANGIGRRAAMSAIASLEDNGWFRVRRFHAAGGTGGPRTVNHYYPQWGRMSEDRPAPAASTSAKKALPPSAEEALPPTWMDEAWDHLGSTGQCQKSTGQSPNEHWGSAGNATGAVLKPTPDSTYSTYPTHQNTYDSADAPEVSGGGRASAPSEPGSASRLTGIEITESWRPSDAAWDLVLQYEGEEDTENALSGFIRMHKGSRIQDPDSRWASHCADWFAPF